MSFRREIHREVAYQQLTFRRRRDVHRRAAAAIKRFAELAGGAQLPLLSLHSYLAGDWPEAYRFSPGRGRGGAAPVRQRGGRRAFGRRAIEAGRRSQVPMAELRAAAAHAR